jgi:hypothetical protein
LPDSAFEVLNTAKRRSDGDAITKGIRMNKLLGLLLFASISAHAQVTLTFADKSIGVQVGSTWQWVDTLGSLGLGK